MIFFNIDRVDFVDDRRFGIYLEGWAFDSDNPGLELAIVSRGVNTNCEIKRFHRPDVKQVFRDFANTSGAGMQIWIDKSYCTPDVTLRMSSAGGEVKDYQIIIEHEKTRRIRRGEECERLFHYIKTLSWPRYKKGLKYLLKFGPRFVYKRLRDRATTAEWQIPSLEQITKILPGPPELKRQRRHVFSLSPLVSLAVPLYNTPENFLRQMLYSVLAQSYEKWELCLADGSDERHSYVGDIIREVCGKDNRVRYIRLKENKGIAGNSNAAVQMATGEYLGLLDHDDILAAHALYEMVAAINANREADMFYSDEGSFIRAVDERPVYHFKPDFAIDNLRSNNYICHFLVAERALFNRAGGFRAGFDGSQDHDLILRMSELARGVVHVPKILYYWRTNPASASNSASSRQGCINSGIRAVQSHLDRIGVRGKVESLDTFTIYRVRYEISGKPLISILIPNCGQRAVLERCVNSILQKTTWDNFEIVIAENNSIAEDIFEYYRALERDPRIRVVRCPADKQFNYSRVNNFAARECRGEYIVFLNNDTEVIALDWLQEMLMLCQRKDVGACGAKLYFSDDTLQHAGIFIGYHGSAGHHSLKLDKYSTGYFGRLLFQQDFSAVTFACCMVKRSVWEAVGGLDEKLSIAYNDVDCCLKIRQKNLLVAWSPFAELYHHESVSRGYDVSAEKLQRVQNEKNYLRAKWPDIFKNGDPYYNVNQTLLRPDFSMKVGDEK